jgi:hypothetical protein
LGGVDRGGRHLCWPVLIQTPLLDGAAVRDLHRDVCGGVSRVEGENE